MTLPPRTCDVCHKPMQLIETDSTTVHAQVESLRERVRNLEPIEAWIKSKHNGYNAYCRKVMPDLKEPETLVQAVEELMQEWQWLEEHALNQLTGVIEERDAARARIEETEGRLAAVRKERDGLREVARGYEQWESHLLLDRTAWGGGTRAFPELTEKLFDELMELQAKRNAALAALAQPAGDGDQK